MDQTPPFQPSFNMEFFSSLHLPHGMALGDSLDHPKHKASFAELESPLIKYKNPMHTDHHADNSFLDHASFFLPQQDDMFHEPFANFKGDSHLKNWQPPQNPAGFLDVSLDPWFSKNNDMDPFQMCRSRGGSFNFGRLRRDSEDLFHMNSDFFRHIRNITDAKTPFENNFMKKPFQMQDAFEMPIDDAHAMQIPQTIPTNQVSFAGNIPAALQGTAMTVSAQNSDSTDDTTGADSAKKRGRKKRMLNDKSEFVDEDSNAKPASKAGRPKKAKDNNDEESGQPKLQKAKSMKKGAKMNDMDGETYVKQEKVDDKSTEISSSSASKIEDSPHGIKPNTDIMSEIMKLKAPENLKEILGGMNVPNEVKEFFQKTTWMGQGVNPEIRKIGTLTLAERKVKIEKYLQKRKKRTWSRKINYDCRKRVADSRLRIKGRFVTRDQAFTLMEEANISFNPETITNAEIKTLLTEKFGGSVLKKKSSDKQDTTICLKRPNEKELDEYELEDNDDFGSALSE